MKRTKHINNCLFLITDRISKKELNVDWFPTNEIIGYLITKPTKFSIFDKFRDLIMGVTPTKKDIQESETKKKSK